ncbi:hypothetical protein [Duganella violaceipulchra]|uniref:DUF3108 domain-containing protein n=1 Tax=Duganella violaceipulchra TaxID=2849652 RepID=A0AA41HKQ3_9BURK|nr:hypothetical protein [Duganella violaceicalia]MBV6325613.1 hypothetical protein [Duganella violaceicalia]MCP2010926.1 hypothetical protein [Duganella violaceicalia]
MKHRIISSALLMAALGLARVAPAAQQAGAPAAEAAKPVATLGEVDVSALREVDEKPYDKIYKGMELFERYHAQAPAAALRFRLYPRVAPLDTAGLVVKLSGDKIEQTLPLDAQLGFSLPRDAAAAAEGAFVSTNRPAKSFAWRADIRSPGVPANARRLGDLRLECKVDLMAADLAAGIKTPAFHLLLAAGVDPCTNRGVSMLYFGERPVFGVALVAGKRRQELPAFALFGSKSPEFVANMLDWKLLRDRLYYIPLWDESWSDDTLVELSYVDDVLSAPATAAHGQPKE